MAVTVRRNSRRGLGVVAVVGMAIALAGCSASDSELDDSGIEIDFSGAGSDRIDASGCVSVASSAAL